MENRVIKFRAWHLNLLEMKAEVQLLDRLADILSRPETYIVMQFTGIHDKEGNEIYEGDLIKAHTFLYRVVFEDAKFVLYHVNSDYGKWGDLCRLAEVFPNAFEVAGNIYQNPELIK